MEQNQMPAVPSLAQARRFGNPRVAGADVVETSLFDYQLYPAAGLAQMSFFNLARGQGVTSSVGAAVGSAKTPQDTNMDMASQLAAGYAFLVKAIELDFQPGASNVANTFTPRPPVDFVIAAADAVSNGIEDVNMVGVGGSLLFQVQGKEFVNDAPLGKFPPSNRLLVDASVATNSAMVGEIVVGCARMGGARYVLGIPRLIDASQNFSLTLNWPAAVALPSGFNGRIGVHLRGLMYRPVQ